MGIRFRTGRRRSKRSGSTSLSKTARKANPQTVGMVVGGIFALAGAGFSLFFIIPALKVLDARGWNEVECVIDSSHVESHRSDDGTTYSVEMTYHYEVDGRTYSSDRYQFMGGSSSGRSGKAKIVKEYPEGSKRSCWVNPKSPRDAVIQRSFTPIYFVILFPFVFVAVGLSLFATSLGKKLRKKNVPAMPDWMPDSALEAMGRRSGSVTLKSKGSPKAKFIGMLIFCLFWNGVVTGMIIALVKSIKSGHTEWGLVLFAAIFGAVGIGVFIGLVHSLLALFNARPKITVSSNVIPLGDTIDLKWQMIGNARKISRLAIKLEGQESATYRRGTDTVTDTSTFRSIEIMSSDDYRDLLSGNKELTIPENTMHSFSASNNKITWAIKVTGEIPRWPDIDESFEIIVLPMRA
ncbi:MAG: DUF3592 domain-containing protein [Kiritimatiellia bacterium]|nr:DUF3592 domain-containing protein [Kiritimatiellia bacterium]